MKPRGSATGKVEPLTGQVSELHVGLLFELAGKLIESARAEPGQPIGAKLQARAWSSL
jgi:hypothetical protein